MFTKNISIDIKKGEKVPLKETYLVFSKSKNNIRLDQKFKDETKNISVSLNFDECYRLMNLLNFYVFDGKYQYYKDKMLIFEKD